ncbi:MAG: exopolysaccharide biosynthesis polyprenyl glycosylphosphotransferase [bacterium]
MNTSRSRLSSMRERFFRSAIPLLISDLFALVVAYYLTLFIRFYNPIGKQIFTWVNVTLGFRESAEVGITLENYYFYNAPRILCLLAATLIPLYGFLNLYARRRLIRRLHAALNVATSCLIALSLFYGYFYLTRNDYHPRSVFATLLGVTASLTILGRWITGRLLSHSRPAVCRVLLIGTGPEAEFIDRYITVKRPEGLEVEARLPVSMPLVMEPLLEQIKDRVVTRRTHMILCAEKNLSVAQIMQLLELGESLGQEVKVLSNKLNVLINEAGVASDYFMELPLVHFAILKPDAPGQRIRQFLFRILAGVVLLLCSPFMLCIGLLIRLSGPGPVFFIQERIGINRKSFRMYKFRTMHDRAEELLSQIEEFNESGEGLFKIKRDPRVTWIGRFLRRLSLDELPQLINVVKGEMTIVGPRPLPRRDFENYYEEWHYSRHSGLPGLTCLWQVSGRSDISFHNMCILDDYYLRNQNTLLDVKIILRTIGVVLFAKGAY